MRDSCDLLVTKIWTGLVRSERLLSHGFASARNSPIESGPGGCTSRALERGMPSHYNRSAPIYSLLAGAAAHS